MSDPDLMTEEDLARVKAEATASAERAAAEYGPLAPLVHRVSNTVTRLLLGAEQNLRAAGMSYEDAMTVVIGAAKEAVRALEAANRFANRKVGS